MNDEYRIGLYKDGGRTLSLLHETWTGNRCENSKGVKKERVSDKRRLSVHAALKLKEWPKLAVCEGSGDDLEWIKPKTKSPFSRKRLRDDLNRSDEFAFYALKRKKDDTMQINFRNAYGLKFLTSFPTQMATLGDFGDTNKSIVMDSSEKLETEKSEEMSAVNGNNLEETKSSSTEKDLGANASGFDKRNESFAALTQSDSTDTVFSPCRRKKKFKIEKFDDKKLEGLLDADHIFGRYCEKQSVLDERRFKDCFSEKKLRKESFLTENNTFGSEKFGESYRKLGEGISPAKLQTISFLSTEPVGNNSSPQNGLNQFLGINSMTTPVSKSLLQKKTRR